MSQKTRNNLLYTLQGLTYYTASSIPRDIINGWARYLMSMQIEAQIDEKYRNNTTFKKISSR